jgi:hypothetical protein
VLSGAGSPEILLHKESAPAIVTGQTYRFYLVSENYVGLSVSASAIAGHRACEAPSGVPAPTAGVTSTTSVALTWTAPADDGGCPLTSYTILAADEVAAPLTY